MTRRRETLQRRHTHRRKNNVLPGLYRAVRTPLLRHCITALRQALRCHTFFSNSCKVFILIVSVSVGFGHGLYGLQLRGVDKKFVQRLPHSEYCGYSQGPRHDVCPTTTAKQIFPGTAKRSLSNDYSKIGYYHGLNNKCVLRLPQSGY